MASSIMVKPGSEYAPCADACGHTDCRETRAMLAHPCRLCGETVKGGQRYYQDPESRRNPIAIVHADCLG